MRVTQSSMYTSFVSNMNENLSAYMESNIQGSSQKRVNKPSDDPVGMTRILTYRNAMTQSAQCEANADLAQGWLKQTDDTLVSVSNTLTTILSKAQQASSSTATDENRKQISTELRQLLGQLLNLSNAEFMDGKKLFAGHQYADKAFEMGLGVTTTDPNLQNITSVDGEKLGSVPWEVSGAADSTIMLRFENDGEIGVDDLDYSWSKDGGKTWVTGTLGADDKVIDMDGVKLTVPVPENPVENGPDTKPLKVTAYNPDKPTGSDNGSMIYIRPAAYYKGDTMDKPPRVDSFGNSDAIKDFHTAGEFKGNVRFRLDSDVDLSVPGQTVKYAYSNDNGLTWLNAEAKTTGNNKLELQTPSGFLTVEMDPDIDTKLQSGHQFQVRPQRAQLGYEIMPGQYIDVTSVGKDIFGGLYAPNGKTPIPEFGGDARNVFETVGSLIAFCETNNVQEIGNSMKALEETQKSILSATARVGGKENRVSTAKQLLQMNSDMMADRKSAIEDVNLTELLTNLSAQQMSYQTVLKSSSMIMQLNLTNYL